MIFRNCALLFVAIFAASHALLAQEKGYPRPELLLEPLQLTKPDVAERFIVLDARERPKYEKGHIPNARWVDHAWARGFHDGREVKEWSGKIGKLGLDADSRIVVYDDNLNKDAARIWWLLRYWGIRDVRLLHGGWTGWKSEKRPIQTEVPPPPTPKTFTARPSSNRLATKKGILAALPVAKTQIVDARSAAENRGVQKLNNKRAGAIPGARHLEWIDLLDRKTQRFKSADELRRLFRAANLDLEKPLTCH
jgi:thiosulfate/3-mercaptopyruvate sulfurtransferase